MISFSYTYSQAIKNNLEKIDDFRKEIMLTPLPLSRSLELSWKATTGYLHAWAALGYPGMRSKLDFIRQNWNWPLPKDTSVLSDFLKSGSLHPILKAGIAHLFFAKSPLAYLIPQCYLYQSGYDCRNMVCLDEFWAKDSENYMRLLTTGQQAAAITHWLEFFTQAAVYQYGLAHRSVLSPFSETHPGIWKLNTRQKKILDSIAEPGSSTNNRHVQSQFKVSQITASRDLSKMAQLGLLFTYGSGRSTYYTRI